MSPNNLKEQVPVSKEQVAEAAAWMAHLHGAKRTPDSDRGHQLWLKEDPSRQRAWEAATEAWEEVAILQKATLAKGIRALEPKPVARKRPTTRLLALAAGLAVVVLGAVVWLRDSGVSTGVGEQRIVALDDGSRVILNTASRVVVRYDGRARRVDLKAGEARFDVAKDAARPFIVTAGRQQVRALGTSFVVRYESDRTAITLVDGKVSVSSATASPESDITLVPGQRVTLARNAPARVDRPSLEKVVAWQRGEVVMDGMQLQNAVAEMNRYSTRKLEVGAGSTASLVISGVFQSGDSLSFANAVAHTYQLQVVEEDNKIVLTGDPKAAYR